jgi:hypothetical protein
MTNQVLRTPGEPPGAMGRILNAKTQGTGGHQAHVPRVEPNCRGQKTPRPAAPAIVLRTPSQQPGTQTHITDVKTRWTGGHQTLFPRVRFSHWGRKPHACNLVFIHNATSRLWPSDLPLSQRCYLYWERNQRGARPASSSSTFLHTWSIKTCDETQIQQDRPHDPPQSSGSCIDNHMEMPEARPASESSMRHHEKGDHTLSSDSPKVRDIAPLAYIIVPLVPSKHVNPVDVPPKHVNLVGVPSKHVNPVDVPAKHINTVVAHAQHEKKGAVQVKHVNAKTVHAQHANTGAARAWRVKNMDLPAKQVKIRVVLPTHYKTGTVTSSTRSWNARCDDDDSPWSPVSDCLMVLAGTQYLSKQGENQSPIAYHSYWHHQESGLPTTGEPHNSRNGCYSRPSTHLTLSMHALSSDNHPAHGSTWGSRKVGRCGGGTSTLSLPTPHKHPSGDSPKPYGIWSSGRGGGNRGPPTPLKR